MKSKINRQAILASIEKSGSTVEDVEKRMRELRKAAGIAEKFVTMLPSAAQQGAKWTGLGAAGVGAGLGLLGIYPAYKALQDSQDRVKQKQQEIAQYQQAIKQLEQNMQNPAAI